LLMTAAKRNIDALLTLFLDRHGADINAVDNQERTALILAWNSRDSGTIKLLISRGADLHPNADFFLGEKLLLWAAKRGDDRLVKLLLDRHSVDNDTKDNRGHTALMLASNAGHSKVVELLIKSGADIEARNSHFNNATALQYAVSKGHKDVEHILIEAANKIARERARIQSNAILAMASQIQLPQTPPPQNEPLQDPPPQDPPPQNSPPQDPPLHTQPPQIPLLQPQPLQNLPPPNQPAQNTPPPSQLSRTPPPEAVLAHIIPPHTSPLHIQLPEVPITNQIQTV
jgi:ankyrin repeat protein